MNRIKVLIINNLISQYKTYLFNQLWHIKDFEFKMIYLGETETGRDWSIETNKILFPFDIIFKGKIDKINPIKVALKVWLLLNLHDPQVIIIGGSKYSYPSYFSALLWSKLKKRKIISIIESHYLNKREKIKTIVKRAYVSNCNAALVAGTRHKEYAVNLGLHPSKIFIMKGVGGVNTKLFLELIPELRNNKANLCKMLKIPMKNYFLYVGRFSPEKNIIFLLKAYKEIRNSGIKDWGLILTGDGPQRTEIKNFIKKNNIDDVILPGFKEKKDLLKFYAISEVFILPSIFECWGLVVDEAMNASLPILVSNHCGCIPDLVKEGVNGFVFDPLDENNLVRLLKNISLGKYDLPIMGKASFNIIKNRTSDKSAEKIKEAIHFVLGKE